MGKRIASVDAYIRRAQPFARPILKHLREAVHASCPDAEEKIKWGMPSFDYKGPFCGMAAFKAHATFGFWKHGLLLRDPSLPAELRRDAMGSFGRITSVDQLPSKRVFANLVKMAMKLNDEGVKKPATAQRKPRPPIKPPAPFLAALERNKKAHATFEAFAPGQRREYLEWITEAKTDETRDRRIATAIEWIAEGKTRNWKYVRPRKPAGS